MINHWTKFEGIPNGRRKEMGRVTLGPNSTISFNAHAYRSFGEPVAVELSFDENSKLIGMMPCDPHKKNAFLFRRLPTHKRATVSVGAFLTHFKIKPKSTVLFDEMDIQSDGMMVLDMKKITNVSRGSR